MYHYYYIVVFCWGAYIVLRGGKEQGRIVVVVRSMTSMRFYWVYYYYYYFSPFGLRAPRRSSTPLLATSPTCEDHRPRSAPVGGRSASLLIAGCVYAVRNAFAHKHPSTHTHTHTNAHNTRAHTQTRTRTHTLTAAYMICDVCVYNDAVQQCGLITRSG